MCMGAHTIYAPRFAATPLPVTCTWTTFLTIAPIRVKPVAPWFAATPLPSTLTLHISGMCR